MLHAVPIAVIGLLPLETWKDAKFSSRLVFPGRIAELLAQSAPGKVLESKFKGLADQVLAEAKRLGCTYAAFHGSGPSTRRKVAGFMVPAPTWV